MSTHVADNYDYQVKRVKYLKETAINSVNQTKTFIANKTNQVCETAIICYTQLNTVLENNYVKMITEPVLNLTETTINYVLSEPDQSII